jgi:proteasome lid subunit RPN8/RPN11
VRIAARVLKAIARHADETAPQECCGLLLGSTEAIIESIAARNTAAEPDRRYTIDPDDHFRAIRQARESGVDVIGAYHSHPRSAPIPSETDRAEACENFVFVIAGIESVGRGTDAAPAFTRSPRRIRAWRLVDGNFVEVALVGVP